MKCYLIILLLGVLPLTLAAAPGQNAYLDAAEKFYIEWDYSDTNITILCRVKTTGWFGIGFSPNGGMAGADIITAGVRDGKPYLQDRHAKRNGYPSVDKSQDVHLISGSESDGITTIKFTRKHNTCDDEDMVIGTDTQRVIYAISPDGSDDLKYHTASHRGTRSLYLRSKVGAQATVPDDSFSFDITVDNYALTSDRTTYVCELKKVPQFDVKHHIIKAEPLIQGGNEGVVHHLIVYGCTDDLDRDHMFDDKNVTFNCNAAANMPQELNACRVAPIGVWAVGGGDMHFPAEAGLPIGHPESPKYFMMEVHYDNPDKVSHIMDNSGMRFTVSKSLRKHDAQILSAGATLGIGVPPGVKDFKFSSFCTSSCTDALIEQPTKVFGSMLHGHLAARSVSARQFRNETEVRVIDQDRGYDFNYQQYKQLQEPVDLLPGDDLMITCNYNTEDRTKMTYGGFGTYDEMCIAFLFVYPATKIGTCFSYPQWTSPYPGSADDFVKNHLKYDSTQETADDVGTDGQQAGLASQLNNFIDQTGNKKVVAKKPAVKWNTWSKVFDKMVRDGEWTEERIKTLERGSLNYQHLDLCFNDQLKMPYKAGWKTYTPGAAVRQLPKPSKEDQMCMKDTDTVIG